MSSSQPIVQGDAEMYSSPGVPVLQAANRLLRYMYLGREGCRSAIAIGRAEHTPVG
jgi:hypothetical protein